MSGEPGDDLLELGLTGDRSWPIFLHIHRLPRPDATERTASRFHFTRRSALRTAWLLVRYALRA